MLNDQNVQSFVLNRLTKPTPNSINMLLLAWDGLSDESKVYILLNLSSIYKNTYIYLTEKILIKALDSKNQYIRYLSKKMILENHNTNKFFEGLKDKEEHKKDYLLGLEKNIKEIIKSDDSILENYLYTDTYIYAQYVTHNLLNNSR